MSNEPATAERQPTSMITALLWATVLLLLAYTLALVVAGDRAPAITDSLSLLTQWVPVIVFWLAAARMRFARWDVNLAAAAVTFSAFGDSYYTAAVDASGYLPSPSPADVGYLLFYPLMVAAVIVIIRRQIRAWVWSVLLDSVVAALGFVGILLAVLSPVLADAVAAASPLDSAIAIAYPLFDVLLVAVVAALAASPTVELGRRWTFLLLGVVVFAAADVVYALLVQTGSYVVDTPLDASWALGLALMTFWVAEQTDRGPREAPTASVISPVPAIAVAGGLLVLVAASQYPVSTVAVAVAAAAVGLAAVPVLIRQALLRDLLDGQRRVVGQLEQLDRAKSEMMSTVNHEIRTPLTSIRGYLDLVLEGEGGEVPTRAEEMLRVVKHNAVRLESLVNDMLTMSRLDATTTPTERVEIELTDLLYSVVASLRPFAVSRDVELTVEESDVHAVVSGDRTQLERAFTNVTENAVKFTPPGGSVGIEVEQDGDMVVVRIIDTGMGIPEADLPLLFDRFYRASNAQSGAVPGTGLGLSIVRSLITAHRGEITISSIEGVSSTVRIELPMVGG